MLLLSMAILFEMLYYSFKRVFLWIIAKMITGFLHAKIMSDSCLVNLCSCEEWLEVINISSNH